MTYTSDSVDWRLMLASERKLIYPDTNCVNDMMIYPAVEQTSHFCGLECLHEWLARQNIRRTMHRNYRRWKKFAP